MKDIFKEQLENGKILTEDLLKGIKMKCFDDGNLRQFEPGEMCIYFLVQKDNKPLRFECTSDRCLDTLHNHFKLVSQSTAPIMEKL
jgi:hypothetical protein